MGFGINYKLFIIAGGWAFIFSSCTEERLSVQNHYLSYKYLASYQVGTPDLRKKCPDYGQQLIMSWSIPEDWLAKGPVFLTVMIRFNNRTIENFSYPLTSMRGTKVYSLFNDAYEEKEGILSYKVEMTVDGVVFEAKHHHLWVEVIELENPTFQSY